MKPHFLLLFTILFAISLFAQTNNNSEPSNLKEVLQKLSKDAAITYVGPTVSAFGSDLNSGWIHRVPKATIFGVDIEFGFVAMGTFFNDETKTFSKTGTFRLNREEAGKIVDAVSTPITTNQREDLITQLVTQDINVGISGPTISGSKKDSVKITFGGGTLTSYGQQINLPTVQVALPVTGYLDEIPLFPLFAPQLTIGTIYGSSVAIRFVPTVKLSDKYGEFSYFGIGVQHNPAMWLPFPLPLEVSLGLFTQTMKIGDVFTSSATTFGLFASKTFGPGAINVTPYAGFSYEFSSADVAYDINVESMVTGTNQTVSGTQHIAFNLTGDNSARMMVGAAFKLGFLSLNVDYNIAKYNAVSAGFGFIF
jgi:hypothetical protein